MRDRRGWRQRAGVARIATDTMPAGTPGEFRREALSLMRSGARTPKEFAAALGCPGQTLRNWLRQDEADRGERRDVLISDERARLCENRALRQEREILKRAAAFAIRESDRP